MPANSVVTVIGFRQIVSCRRFRGTRQSVAVFSFCFPPQFPFWGPCRSITSLQAAQDGFGGGLRCRRRGPREVREAMAGTGKNIRRMAERVGFEPTVPFWSTQHFQCCTIGQLGHLSPSAYQMYRFKSARSIITRAGNAEHRPDARLAAAQRWANPAGAASLNPARMR